MRNLIFFALLGLIARAHASGKVEFLAVGRPSFIKIHGTGKEPEAKVTIKGNKADGIFDFDLTSLDTGIGLRNEHMNGYLGTKDFPRAKLEIKDLPLKAPQSIAPVSDADFTGNLTLHGVTKPVTGKYSINSDGDVTSSFSIKLSDFNIEIPSHLGVTLKDDVDVQVEVDKLKGAM